MFAPILHTDITYASEVQPYGSKRWGIAVKDDEESWFIVTEELSEKNVYLTETFLAADETWLMGHLQLGSPGKVQRILWMRFIRGNASWQPCELREVFLDTPPQKPWLARLVLRTMSDQLFDVKGGHVDATAELFRTSPNVVSLFQASDYEPSQSRPNRYGRKMDEAT